MFVCKKIWKSIIIQFLFVNIIYSQIPQFKTFTTQQGLSTYNTRKIIRDNFGFLWITTQDGMNRFDGTQFTILNKNTGGKTTANNSIKRKLINYCQWSADHPQSLNRRKNQSRFSNAHLPPNQAMFQNWTCTCQSPSAILVSFQLTTDQSKANQNQSLTIPE